MGSIIEINDTLKISKSRGFPEELDLESHIKNPELTFEKIKGKKFSFWNKNLRIYHTPPTRVFLVEEVNGRWLYWGHAIVTQQTINRTENKTTGLFEIIKIYDPAYQKLATINEPPERKGYFT